MIEDPEFKSITVLVDSKTSLENTNRLLTNRKDLQFSVKKEEDYAVTIIRP